MKKKLLIIIACVAGCERLYAQAPSKWARSTADTTTIYNINSGKVGIGTMFPNGKLEVSQPSATNGTALVLSTTGGFGVGGGTGLQFKDSNAETGHIQVSYDGVMTNMHFGGLFNNGYTTASNQLMTILGNGNVGIGANNPGQKLVVKGVIRSILSGEFAEKNVVNIIPMGFSGNTGAQNWAIRGVYQHAYGVGLNADGGDLDIIKSINGNTALATKPDGSALGFVGIGTTSPKEKLELFYGDFRITNNEVGNRVMWYRTDNTHPTGFTSDGFSRLGIVTNGTEKAVIQTDGKVGIGTTGPTNIFQIGNVGGFYNNQQIAFSDGTGDNAAFNVAGSYLEQYSSGGMHFNVNGVTPAMTVLPNANVGIGTAHPDSTLTVNGSIHSKSVTIDLSVPAPDYVFDKAYDLKSLTDVQKYIARYKHLPEIPSAAEMAKDGLNVGEMNMILLKKVEELTLYLLDKDNEISLMRSEFKKELQAQSTELSKIREKVNAVSFKKK